MKLRFETVSLTKRVALTISRGSSAGSRSSLIEIESDGVVGMGEAAEWDIPGHSEDSLKIESDLMHCQGLLASSHPLERQAIEESLLKHAIGPSVRAAVDMALYDWAGKAVRLPVWKLLGLGKKPRGPTSVTIGINSPEGAVQRLQRWQELGTIRAIKIKLGSPAGVESDQAMFLAVRDAAPKDAYLGVDANGGWTLEQAIGMSKWLADHGAVHIEQPLAVDRNEQLSALYTQAAIPIFIDESCRSVRDVVRWGNVVHGINIKITKCGGLSEAMRMIATANAFGLKTMVGCYGNTSLSNAAAHHLASLIDYIDLDSHLNISNDPFTGLTLVDGYLSFPVDTTPEAWGLGISYA